MCVIQGALSTQTLTCIEQLKALDLSPIAAYLMNPQNGYGWTKQQTYRSIERYKTFLFVCHLNPHIVLVPTQEIDRVWHCHILHTRKYRQDCELLFGYFVDHEPESECRDEANSQNMEAAFAQTQALLAVFEEYFTEEGQEGRRGKAEGTREPIGRDWAPLPIGSHQIEDLEEASDLCSLLVARKSRTMGQKNTPSAFCPLPSAFSGELHHEQENLQLYRSACGRPN